MIGERYETLLAALLDELEAALCVRASRRLETELEQASAAADLANAPRFAADRVLLCDETGRVRALPFDDARAQAALAALPARGGLQARAEAIAALRRRHAMLRERRRLRERLHTLEGERKALQRLRESEIAEAEAARRRLLARRRRRREPIAPSLRRPVPEIVIERARALVRAEREGKRTLAALEARLDREPSPLAPCERALLAAFERLGRLVRVCTQLVYEPLAERLLARYRTLALATTGACPQRARAFMRDLAFLMAKANFEPLDHERLERGFALGPAPGVRLQVPLEPFAFACFFVRSERIEPTHHGTLAPHYDKFAFCLLERDLVATTQDDRPRRRGATTRLGRLRERLRCWYHSRRRRTMVALARRLRRTIAPRVERVGAYLARLSPLPPSEVALDPALKIKLFRDVRLGELGLVLPGARIRYRIFDLVLVWGGATSGLLAKLAQKPLGILLAPKLFISLLAAVIGRGLLGLRRSRTHLDRLRESYENRHLQATRMHAVQYFVREAIETDAKEMLLVYGLGLREAIERDELDAQGRFTLEPVRTHAAVERFVREHFRAEITLDLLDAAGGLEALELLPRPGVLAPGPTPPDYFDERLLGRSFRQAAIARWIERGSVASRTRQAGQSDASAHADDGHAPPPAPALPERLPLLAPAPALALLRRRIARTLGLDDADAAARAAERARGGDSV